MGPTTDKKEKEKELIKRERKEEEIKKEKKRRKIHSTRPHTPLSPVDGHILAHEEELSLYEVGASARLWILDSGCFCNHGRVLPTGC
jgi:hypothetical protein